MPTHPEATAEWIDHRPSCVTKILDNQGATVDRYTICIQGPLERECHVLASREQAKDRGIFEHRDGSPEPNDDEPIDWVELPTQVRTGVLRSIGEIYERRQ